MKKEKLEVGIETPLFHTEVSYCQIEFNEASRPPEASPAADEMQKSEKNFVNPETCFPPYSSFWDDEQLMSGRYGKKNLVLNAVSPSREHFTNQGGHIVKYLDNSSLKARFSWAIWSRFRSKAHKSRKSIGRENIGVQFICSFNDRLTTFSRQKTERKHEKGIPKKSRSRKEPFVAAAQSRNGILTLKVRF